MATTVTTKTDPSDPEYRTSWTLDDMAQLDADLNDLEQQIDLIAGSANNSDLAARIRALGTRIGQRRGFLRAAKDNRGRFIPVAPAHGAPAGAPVPGAFVPGVTPMPGAPTPRP